jgi:hypothetical protein
MQNKQRANARKARKGWSDDGAMLLTTIARASNGSTLDSVELAVVDPATGAVTPTGIPGAGPRPQPNGPPSCEE